MKPAYYQNYCIDSNQILHNTKVTPQQTQNGRRPPFWKKVLPPYIRIRVTAFIEIWHGDTYWHGGDRRLKFRIFENPSWRTAVILKTVKSLYVRNRLPDLDKI